MERMRNKDLENAWAVQGIRQEKCAKLEEENKKLKKENFVMKDRLKFGYKGVTREEIERAEEENKKLNEKVRFLEECLDRKEKLNEKYRKELKNYVYDAKQVRDIC